MTTNHDLHDYSLRLDGPQFRCQRQLLSGLADKVPNGDRDALEGLMSLLDEIADQAHDRHGIDCLVEEPLEEQERLSDPESSNERPECRYIVVCYDFDDPPSDRDLVWLAGVSADRINLKELTAIVEKVTGYEVGAFCYLATLEDDVIPSPISVER